MKISIKERWSFKRLLLGTTLIAFTILSCKKSAPIQKVELSNNIKLKNSTSVLAYNTPIKLFDGGSGDYHSYRIPSLIRTKNGTLIAICEGRADNNKDFGNINVVCRRSTNNGASWGAEIVIQGASLGTWGNPTAVVDQDSGTIYVLMSWNAAGYSQFGDDGTTKITEPGQRRVYYTKSTQAQDGTVWSSPVNITSTATPTNKVWDAVGPGIGIQKRFGATAGRLIIPAIGRNIYSDDGTNWYYTSLPGGTSEGTIVERLNGRLMRNDRAVSSNEKYRYKSVENTNGTWPAFVPVSGLPDPHCQGSILRYTDSPSRILLMNSASQTTRTAMRIRISNDEGAFWPTSKAIPQHGTGNGKMGGYSSLAKSADNMIAALIEYNENTTSSSTSHRSIYFYKFNLAWINQ